MAEAERNIVTITARIDPTTFTDEQRPEVYRRELHAAVEQLFQFIPPAGWHGIEVIITDQDDADPAPILG